MNVLFILPQIPYPPHSGGRIVTWNTLKRFSRECRVSAVCLYHHPDELKHLDSVKEYCEEVAAFPAYEKWAKRPMIKSLFSSRPFKAHRFFNPDMFIYIQRMLQRHKFDVIHAQNFYTAAYVRGDEPCLKVHYKENIEGNILSRWAEHSINPAIKFLASLEGMRTKRYELESCRKFDRILTISPIDRDELLSMDENLPICHQRPGVDLDDYPLLEDIDGPPTLVFTGTMSYYPNTFGAYDFLTTIWPELKRHLPELQCYIVGAGPPEYLTDFDGQDGITITGKVANVRDYLRKAWLYIVPLYIGGGIRLKILEAMASGRTVVSTPIGCEGLDVKDGEHLRIATNTGQFIQSIVELIKNKNKRDRLQQNARRLMEEVYSWDKIIPHQVAQYRSLCSL